MEWTLATTFVRTFAEKLAHPFQFRFAALEASRRFPAVLALRGQSKGRIERVARTSLV